MTAMLSRPVDLAVEALTERSMCIHCSAPVHSHDGIRGWRHTLTDRFRCTTFDGWAEPFSREDTERQVYEACAEAAEIGRESGWEDGCRDGRYDMHDELDKAINAALDLVECDDDDRMDADAVREAVDRAIEATR